jgi:glycosyltransferase involved in cell wall biosynthesis
MSFRVAFLVDKVGPIFLGGYERRMSKLARRLAMKHDVRIYSSMTEERADFGGVTYCKVAPMPRLGPRASQRDYFHSFEFAARVSTCPFRDWDPDVIVIEAIPYLHLVAATRWIRRTHALRILSVDEAWSGYTFGRGIFARPSRVILRFALSTGISWSDLVIAASSVTKQSLAINFGARRVEVIPNGIDLAESGTDVAQPSRPMYDFVTLGRLVPIKRQAEFVEALARIRLVRGWNGRAAIVGDGPMLPRLLQVSRAGGLLSNIDFLGQVSDTEKYRVLKASRIFVLCSEREGFSISTLEAMALGLPVIVARPRDDEVFGQTDFLQDGINGLTYPSGDIERLSMKMLELLENANRCTALGGEARSTAARYSWNAAGVKLEDLIGASLPSRTS